MAKEAELCAAKLGGGEQNYAANPIALPAVLAAALPLLDEVVA